MGATSDQRHFHGYRLEDITPEAHEADVATMRGDVQRLRAIPADGLSDLEVTDRRLLTSELEADIRTSEELRPLNRYPQDPLDIALFGPFLLLIREFAPLEERMASLLARTEAVPELLEVAKSNLRAGENIPAVWVTVAEEVAEGGAEFWGETVPEWAEQTPALREQVLAAARRANEAFDDYVRFLREELRPRADGEFAVGRELFDFLLRTHHMLPYDSDDLHELGTELIADTQRQMAGLAEEIEPGKPWDEIVKELKGDHPGADGVLEAYRAEMAKTRDFVRERDLVSIPPGEELDVVDTPPFERATTPYAAYVMPAPFEEQQKGFFWVTPVDEAAPAEERQQQLEGHCNWGLPVVSLHEGYPGHHLQLCHSNRVDSLVRKQFGTSVFAEGWALYCEEMMYEAGFYTDPRTRLFQLKDILWRACRVVIDVGLHTRGMGFDEAVNMLVDMAGLERTNAIKEVQRYTASPTQPMSYAIGKREILRLREDYERANAGAFCLKEFHDELLSFGTIPAALVRSHMLP
ncbi:MAG: DUF885 domain-containing protein [Armatimonadota bacterium]